MTGRDKLLAFSKSLGLSALVLLLDQISKMKVLDYFSNGQHSWGENVPTGGFPLEVIPGFLNMVLVWNRGVSFGMFNNDGDRNAVILCLFALILAVGMAIWLWRATTRLQRTGLALIIGGAVGNAIDRMLYGAVVDFVDVHVSTYHWPAFNVADSAICIGAALLVLDAFGNRHRLPDSGV